MTIQVTVESDEIAEMDDNEAAILAHELSMALSAFFEDQGFEDGYEGNVEVIL